MAKKLRKNPQALLGLFIIAILILVALLAPTIAPHDPDAIDITLKFSPPSRDYPLGTDQLGRCEFSRLLYGTRYSIGMSLPTLVVLSVVGLGLGCLCVCSNKWIDRVLTLLCDIFIAFPALIIAAAIIGVLGNGVQNIAISVILAMWAWFTKMVRSYAIIEMGRDYMLAARIAGCSTRSLIVHHLVPNILPQFIVYLSTGVASTILTISGFAFLGLGLPAGTAEWGAMLNDARSCLYSHPQLLLYPGICIFFAAAGFNLFGEALRDILSPQEGQ